jgi:hypothetical protein
MTLEQVFRASYRWTANFPGLPRVSDQTHYLERIPDDLKPAAKAGINYGRARVLLGRYSESSYDALERYLAAIGIGEG